MAVLIFIDVDPFNTGDVIEGREKHSTWSGAEMSSRQAIDDDGVELLLFENNLMME